MQKIEIKNRKDQKLVIVIDLNDTQKGLAFVMHGLSAHKDQAQIKAFANACFEEGLTVVRFDTTNTFGESDGNYEDATVTNYYEDLEDVISWAKDQVWFQEPFYILGHSLGGMCVTLFAEKYPEKIKGLMSFSPVISGQLSEENKLKKTPEAYENWKNTGWQIEESHSKPGTFKKLKWSHMEDRKKYDLLLKSRNLAMPVLLLVGEEDSTTPPEHIKKLFDSIPDGKKTFKIMKEAGHSFREEKHLNYIRNEIREFISLTEVK